MINILIADDHAIVREGLKQIDLERLRTIRAELPSLANRRL